ncbi:MAG: 30S ribosomal protein S13 [Myxococcota bacterium]
MARIAGVDLPVNKPLEIALTYIYGIGPLRSKKVLRKANIPGSKRTDALSEEEIAGIRSAISFPVEGDLRREVTESIRRLIHEGCYRGTRHLKGLPVRGQRTHSNAKTCRKKKFSRSRS